jgi:hypothetical protein
METCRILSLNVENPSPGVKIKRMFAVTIHSRVERALHLKITVKVQRAPGLGSRAECAISGDGCLFFIAARLQIGRQGSEG